MAQFAPKVFGSKNDGSGESLQVQGKRSALEKLNEKIRGIEQKASPFLRRKESLLQKTTQKLFFSFFVAVQVEGQLQQSAIHLMKLHRDPTAIKQGKLLKSFNEI
jgi:hypothetical protein